MNQKPETIVGLLDRQYGEILEDAKELAASYINASMRLYKETGIKSGVAAVSIKQTSPNACSISWCKIVPLRGEQNKFVTLTIPKGNGKFKYPASSFEFINYPYRGLIVQVEEQLSEIRRIASENRQLRRTLVAYERKLVSFHSRRRVDLSSSE